MSCKLLSKHLYNQLMEIFLNYLLAPIFEPPPLTSPTIVILIYDLPYFFTAKKKTPHLHWPCKMVLQCKMVPRHFQMTTTSFLLQTGKWQPWKRKWFRIWWKNTLRATRIKFSDKTLSTPAMKNKRQFLTVHKLCKTSQFRTFQKKNPN